VGVINLGGKVPNKFELFQNCPNPFNPITKIRFTIPPAASVRRTDIQLIIYDILGREIQTLVNGELKPGVYEVNFNAEKLSSGVYLYRIEAGDFIDSKKMVLIK
jgi:hypothetical protein